MNLKVVVLLFSGIGQHIFAQSLPEKVQGNTIFNMADIIAVPRYPRLAHLSGQSGQYVAIINVSREGKGEVVSIEGGSKTIIESIRNSLKVWTFRPQDEAGQIVIHFDFRLIQDDGSISELVTEIFPDSNRVVIKARKITVVRSSGY